MNDNFFSKEDPAINEHHYTIIKQQCNEETHNVYNIDKTNTYNIKHSRYADEHYYNKTQNVNNNITNNISNKNIISNNEHVLNLKNDYSSNNHISNNYKSQIAYVENNLYKRYDNRTLNNTHNISKTINQYTADVVNTYKTNRVSNLKKAYYNLLMVLLIHIIPYTLMIISL